MDRLLERCQKHRQATTGKVLRRRKGAGSTEDVVSREERESRYRNMAGELLGLAIKDIKCDLTKINDLALNKLLVIYKRDAKWFIFASSGFQGLLWWCDLLKISSLRVKRRAKEILDKQKITSFN